ncbi:hypothetical protein [Cohnella nanjingensis]|uniref:Uncharacterized protein n=1 Tax=Cohnella nanjingensis TaxID=1387779 RepID=A0A7X0RYN9_9BACL|nr:hypothetical protein [Cohnella nanjingensis]MBB6674509.1 hypothetical protein [Cohnella nanjingensis]
MADMKIAGVDFVIDADGFKQTETALQAMDKYMEKLQQRAERLSRIRITPIVKLSDCLCEPLRKIRTSLESLTKKAWVVSVRAQMSDYSAIVKSGKDAGQAFSASFTDRFDASGIALKVQRALNRATLNAELLGGSSNTGKTDCCCENSNSKQGIDWKEKIVDFGSSVLSGYISNKLSDLPSRRSKASPGGNGHVGGRAAPNPAATHSGILRADGNGYYPSPQLQTEVTKKPSLLQRFLPKNKAVEQFSGVEEKLAKSPATESTAAAKIITGNQSVPDTPKKIYGADGNVLSVVSPESSVKAEPSVSRMVGKTKSFGSKLLDNALLAGSSPLGKGMLKTSKFLGKLSKPLGIVSDVAQIATASNGTERAKAVGSVAGGWGGAAAGAAAGAAIGSIIPVVGTAIGGIIGGALGGMGGSAIGDFVGGLTGRFLGKKKKKKDPVSLPEPDATSGPMNLTGGAQGILMGAAIATAPAKSPSAPAKSPSAPAPTPQPPPPSIQIPTGAVQITVKENNLDYDAIARDIGAKLAASMKQAMENRA